MSNSPCNSFDGEHHYKPRRFGSVETGNLRTALGCACGNECPKSEVAAVKAALEETDREKERQRVLAAKVISEGAFVGRLL